ncbi:MAG: nucleoside deaminase [Methanomicrobiales archaeon]
MARGTSLRQGGDLIMDDRRYMQEALRMAHAGIGAGNSPFGACVAGDGRIISCRHNEVLETTDITAHAEILALRDACTARGTIDLSGCTLYSTAEPCPMCFAAAHWARIARIVYAVPMDAVWEAGFREIPFFAQEFLDLPGVDMEVTGGICSEEGYRLLEIWRSRPDRQVY